MKCILMRCCTWFDNSPYIFRTCSKSSGIHRKRPPLQGEARSEGLEQLVRRARKLGRGRTMPITR